MLNWHPFARSGANGLLSFEGHNCSCDTSWCERDCVSHIINSCFRVPHVFKIDGTKLENRNEISNNVSIYFINNIKLFFGNRVAGRRIPVVRSGLVAVDNVLVEVVRAIIDGDCLSGVRLALIEVVGIVSARDAHYKRPHPVILKGPYDLQSFGVGPGNCLFHIVRVIRSIARWCRHRPVPR